MWAYFCWLQKSWVCRLILNTMPSCPALTPMLHSTIGLNAGSAERPPLHQWKASRGGCLHFKEKTFSKFANTFNNNHMWCLFIIWWHLTTLRWTHVTMDIMWLIWSDLNDYFTIHKANRSRSNFFFFLPDFYQIWGGVIWLTPEKKTSNIYCPYMLGTNRAIPRS